jgi:predicted transcriptional regulator
VQYEKCKCCGGSGKQISHRALGLEMREKRIKKGITLREMAELIGVSAPYVSDLERGNRSWPKHILKSFQQNL